LRDRTRCITVMGRKSKVDMVSMRVDDGDTIDAEGVSLGVLYTPGHTDDSYCYCLADRVFTGDTLLIRGTGRTDFQNGNSAAAYASLFDKLLRLPDATLVYPGHDYKGDTVSTIGEEKAHNPRLQVASAEEYAAIMDGLDLDNPKMMDLAVPANLATGLSSNDPAIREHTLTPAQAMADGPWAGALFVDLRDEGERRRDGVILNSVHAPYGALDRFIKPGGMLAAMAAHAGKPLILYCAYGERSALALKTMHEVGLEDVAHLGGGVAAWAVAGGRLDPVADEA
jgi:rhodanese-related sulfurtransferase